MAGKMRVVYEKTADGPVAVAASADASAFGQNTLASSTISATMTSHGRVTISSGTVTATASATSTDGGGSYATAGTEVTSNTDILRTSTTTSSGSGDTDSSSWSFETSTTRYFAVDIEGVDLGHGPVSLDMTKDAVVVSQPELDDGNAATLYVDVTAYGSSTYVGVEAEVLAVQDQMSHAVATTLISSDGF